MTWVGALTAFFAATIAVGQSDIKKVLAYSTISQLGFMVAAVGMGAYVAGMFHLVTHAFFKALLFLAAGSVILGMEHGRSCTGMATTAGMGSLPVHGDSIRRTCATWAACAIAHAGHFLGLPDRRAGPVRDCSPGRVFLQG